jgi:hypothetical protein
MEIIKHKLFEVEWLRNKEEEERIKEEAKKEKVERE